MAGSGDGHGWRLPLPDVATRVLGASTAIVFGVAARLGRSLGDALAWIAQGEQRAEASAVPPLPKFSDELVLCWCCGASSSCRCEGAGRCDECGWCRQHCRCFRPF